MREGGLPYTRDIFDQEVSASEQAHDGELDDATLPLDDLLDIVLDGSYLP